MDDDIQEKINQIQLLQQNLQNFSMQRQQFQMQQTEIESALAELDKSEKSYKIIGNVMVLTDKNDLKKELEEKNQMMKIRISTIEKQESKIQEKAEGLQKEVLQEIERKQDSKKQKNDNK
jgi:prefoldin beta subunit